MKRIMLVCNAGMSTSMIVTKMEKESEKRGLSTEIFAVPVSEVDNQVAEKEIDVILVGPQIKFMLKEYKDNFSPEIKVDSIEMKDYGTMNGANILNTALEMLEE